MSYAKSMLKGYLVPVRDYIQLFNFMKPIVNLVRKEVISVLRTTVTTVITEGFNEMYACL